MPSTLIQAAVGLQCQPFEHGLFAGLAGYHSTELPPIPFFLHSGTKYELLGLQNIPMRVLLDKPQQNVQVFTAPVTLDLAVGFHPHIEVKILADAIISLLNELLHS